MLNCNLSTFNGCCCICANQRPIHKEVIDLDDPLKKITKLELIGYGCVLPKELSEKIIFNNNIHGLC